MNTAIKIIIGLLCIPLLILGANTMFNPLAMVEKLAITPLGSHGLNTIRGDIGGLLVGGGLMMIVGLVKQNSVWFLATMLMMLTVAFGRLIGFIVDGFDATMLPPFIVELVIATVMVVARKRLYKS